MTNNSNLWNTALLWEGLESASTSAEIDMVSNTMSQLTAEAIEIRSSLDEWMENGDQNSQITLRNNLLWSIISKIFPQEAGMTLEVYTEHLLKQVE